LPSIIRASRLANRLALSGIKAKVAARHTTHACRTHDPPRKHRPLKQERSRDAEFYPWLERKEYRLSKDLQIYQYLPEWWYLLGGGPQHCQSIRG
jgi:hypothetical protein